MFAWKTPPRGSHHGCRGSQRMNNFNRGDGASIKGADVGMDEPGFNKKRANEIKTEESKR